MSESAFEPAPTPTLRQIPRRYLALGLIIIAIVLLGALVLVRDNAGPSTSSTVETFSPAPSSLIATVAAVPTSVYDAVGVSSPANPVMPLRQIGERELAVVGATVDGEPPEPVVFFYGAEFAPYAAVRALAARPRPLAFRHLRPARPHAVERDDRVRRPVDVHLLERLVLEPLRWSSSRSSATAP